MNELQKVAYYLHTMSCIKRHATEMIDIDDPDMCCFYLEESIENSWSYKDHQIWEKKAEEFILLAQPHGLEDVMRHMHTVAQIFEGFKEADPMLAEYVRQIILKEN